MRESILNSKYYTVVVFVIGNGERVDSDFFVLLQLMSIRWRRINRSRQKL